MRGWGLEAAASVAMVTWAAYPNSSLHHMHMYINEVPKMHFLAEDIKYLSLSLSLSVSHPPSLFFSHFLSFSRPRSSGTAMKLGSKGKKNVDSFVDQLVAEGESKFLFISCLRHCGIDDLYRNILNAEVTSASAARQSAAVATKTPAQVNVERSVQ